MTEPQFEVTLTLGEIARISTALDTLHYDAEPVMDVRDLVNRMQVLYDQAKAIDDAIHDGKILGVKLHVV